MTWLLAQSGNAPSPLGNINWVKLIIWAAFISLTIFGWIMKWVTQKRAQSQAMMAKRRREEEALRTGRDITGSPVATAPAPVTVTPASHEEARRRLQEIARRRRAELEQLRASGPDASRTALAPSSAAPLARPSSAVPRPMAATGRDSFPSTARPQPSKPAALPPRPEQRKKKQSRPQPARPQAQPTQPTLEQKLNQAAAAGAYAVVPLAAPLTLPGAPAVQPGHGPRIRVERASTPGGIESLRKALLLAEVLAPPVCMRSEHDDGAGAILRPAG